MAARFTRSILVTLSDSHWNAIIAKLSETNDPSTDGAARALLAQLACEAVRAPIKGANGHEKRT